MRNRVLALLLLSCALPALPQVVDLHVEELADRAVTIEFTRTGTGNVTVTLDAGPAAGTLSNNVIPSSNSSVSGPHWRTLHRAPANANYYYRISLAGTPLLCTGSCTNCTTSDNTIFAETNTAGINDGSGSGFHCGGDGQPPYIFHPALSETTAPNPPNKSVEHPNELWDGVGESITEVESSCENLASTYSTHRLSGNSSSALVIKIPPGLCEHNIWSPAANNWKVVVVTTNTALRITPKARAIWEHMAIGNQMAIIQEKQPWRNESAGVSSFITAPSNFILDQVVLRSRSVPYQPIQCEVSEVDNELRRITITPANCMLGLTLHHQVVLSLPGLTAYPGFAYVGSYDSTTGIIVISNQSGISKDDVFAGSYTSGGLVTWGSNLPLSSVEAGDPTLIHFSFPHGLPNPATATVQQDHVYLGRIDDPGSAGINGTHVYEVVDADTIRLPNLDTDGATLTPTALAFVRYNSGPRNRLFTGNGQTSVYLSHVLAGTPYFGQFHSHNPLAFSNGNGAGFFDGSVLGGGDGWQINPATGLANTWYSSTLGFDAFRLDGCRMCQFSNISITGGMKTAHFNAQNGARLPQDIIIKGVEAYVTRRHFMGSDFPTSLGLHVDDPRQCIEMKGGVERMLVDGLWCNGAAIGAPFHTTGYAVFLANTVQSVQASEPRFVRDFKMVNWRIEGFGSPFGIGTQIGGPTQHHAFNNRVEVANGTHVSDLMSIRIQPQSYTNTAIVPNVAGYQFTATMGTLNLNVHHNSFRWVEGAGGIRILLYAGDAWPNCSFSNNIFQDFGNTPIATVAANFMSPVDGTNFYTRFQSVCPGGTFNGNMVLPAVNDPSQIPAKRASTADADNMDDEWNSRWGDFPSLVPGPAGSSYNARLEGLWPGGSYIPHSDYSSYGPDMTAIRRAVGKVLASEPLQTSATSMLFSWTAPNTQGGTVRISSNCFDSSQTTLTDVGGDYSQSVEFSGLTPGGHYCAFLEHPDGESLYWEFTLE